MCRVRSNAGRSAFVCATCFLLVADPSAAQGRLEVNYEAALAGLTVGKGSWIIRIDSDRYEARASASMSGFLTFFTRLEAYGQTSGQITKGLDPRNYGITTRVSDREEAVQLSLANGDVTHFSVNPEPPPDANRIPLAKDQLRNVVDPMTAMLIFVPKSVDLISPDACNSSPEVFGGRMRYQLKFTFSRLEHISLEGYRGVALVCGLRFSAISGYNPDKPVVKYLSGVRDAEVWFVSISGTRVLAPVRLVLPTPFGRGVVQAIDFATHSF
jgi:Protein of unknown function (DUF3108)